MHKAKAERLIRRKFARAKACPFCGQTPDFEARVDERSSSGSTGHYALRKPCCRPTALGQTRLFFVNDGKPANYRLWWRMASRLINEWNQRAAA